MQLEFLAQIYDAMVDGQMGFTVAAHSSVMLAGHSRGGKLAALHYAAGDCCFSSAARLFMLWKHSPCSCARPYPCRHAASHRSSIPDRSGGLPLLCSRVRVLPICTQGEDMAPVRLLQGYKWAALMPPLSLAASLSCTGAGEGWVPSRRCGSHYQGLLQPQRHCSSMQLVRQAMHALWRKGAIPAPCWACRLWESATATGNLGGCIMLTQDLCEAGGHGSELRLEAAGHMQFAQHGGIERLVADDLCGHNASVDNAQVWPGNPPWERWRTLRTACSGQGA